jgi:hypothetical protein
MTDRPVPASPRRRPLGGIVLAILQFARAILVLRELLDLDVGDGLDWLRTAAQVPDAAPGTVAFTISRGLAVGILLASVAIGIGLLANRRWAWVGAIVISGLSLAFALGAWWDGNPMYLAMAINVVAVFYLNQREVRAEYEEAPPLEPPATVLEADSPTAAHTDGAAS